MKDKNIKTNMVMGVKNKKITIRLNDSIFNALQIMSKDMNKSISDIIRELLIVSLTTVDYEVKEPSNDTVDNWE